ncbi:hypothetical protein MLD38_037281 [Melastoma candidum]|uniref:Uncharacterized protein n=1 Tax=Melastoma candidum TaxID=119954 RepID=A0ACB9LLV3_9MYRT|nr:hypothetical protein MLD38_037281 [Melastoma candidum]
MGSPEDVLARRECVVGELGSEDVGEERVVSVESEDVAAGGDVRGNMDPPPPGLGTPGSSIHSPPLETSGRTRVA